MADRTSNTSSSTQHVAAGSKRGRHDTGSTVDDADDDRGTSSPNRTTTIHATRGVEETAATVATTTRISPMPWERFKDRKYILLRESAEGDSMDEQLECISRALSCSDSQIETVKVDQWSSPISLSLMAMELFSAALKTNKTLTVLELDTCLQGQDTTELVRLLSAGISNNTALLKLSLGHNCIGSDEAPLLTDMLVKNASMLELQLSGNTLASCGASVLAGCLPFNKTLRRLNLETNGIGDEGLESLARAMRNATGGRLQELELRGNQCSNRGVAAIADMLTTNQTLLSLDLSDNCFDYEGVLCLARALETENETLEYLGMVSRYTNVGEYDAEDGILDARTENTGLIEDENSWVHRAPTCSMAIAQQQHEQLPWLIQRYCFRNVLLRRTVDLIDAFQHTNQNDNCSALASVANFTMFLPHLFRTFRLYTPEQYQRLNAVVLYGALRAHSKQTKLWLSLRKTLGTKGLCDV